MVCWSLQFSVTPPTLSVSGLISSSLTSPKCLRLLSGKLGFSFPFLFKSVTDEESACFFLLLRLFFFVAVKVVASLFLGLFRLFFMITGCCGGSKLINPLASRGWRSPEKSQFFNFQDLEYHAKQIDNYLEAWLRSRVGVEYWQPNNWRIRLIYRFLAVVGEPWEA